MKKLFKRFVFAALILLFCICFYWVYDARHYTESTVLIDLHDRQWRLYEAAPTAMNTDLNSLSPLWQSWLLKVQDPSFYSHNGIDLKTPGAGLTTITQSLVKKLYFSDFKPGLRKIPQTLIAYYCVDNLISKEQQLALFINIAYMGALDGQPIYGLENAAQHYFGRSLALLDDEQFLSLVAMLIGADRYNVEHSPELNLQRVERIKRMLSGDYVPDSLTDVYYDH